MATFVRTWLPLLASAETLRITDWEPLEISLVAVPADATVGVGRSADSTRKQEGSPMPDTTTAHEREDDTLPAAERRRMPGTSLSGGQQQMAAIGRALMANPRILLCDEISLGLAPIVIRDIYNAIPAIKAEGTSILLVEQDIVQAMAVADRVYCFQEGRVSLAGRPSELTREQIHTAYFGTQ